VRFRGVLAHAGHAYACKNVEEIEAVAIEEREVTTAFADRLRASGLEVPEVSIGSTPTMSVAHDLTGVTEVRPGNYVFFDAFQAAIGSCSWDDIAFTVLTTVIGRYPDRDTLVVDAGALALSKDDGARHVDPRGGYGVLLSEDGLTRYDELRVVSLSQEHGVVRASGGLRGGDHPVGERLRIAPNHSCLAAAMFERYHVISDGQVIEEWRPVRGWG
jgi:D-serine deaminase-like pyridoxal phosphate-dependent protein